MTRRLRLTDTQIDILMRSRASRPIAGLVTFEGSAGTGVGLRRAAWLRSVRKLEDYDYLRTYPHGGYEVTEEGQAFVAANAASYDGKRRGETGSD